MTYDPGRPPGEGNPWGALAVLVALVAMLFTLIAICGWAVTP